MKSRPVIPSDHRKLKLFANTLAKDSGSQELWFVRSDGETKKLNVTLLSCSLIEAPSIALVNSGVYDIQPEAMTWASTATAVSSRSYRLRLVVFPNSCLKHSVCQDV
jgi:hypothetical protein